MQQNRFVQRKKNSKKRYPADFTARFNVNKVSFIFKILPPVYLHIMKMYFK